MRLLLAAAAASMMADAVENTERSRQRRASAPQGPAEARRRALLPSQRAAEAAERMRRRATAAEAALRAAHRRVREARAAETEAERLGRTAAKEMRKASSTHAKASEEILEVTSLKHQRRFLKGRESREDMRADRRNATVTGVKEGLSALSALEIGANRLQAEATSRIHAATKLAERYQLAKADANAQLVGAQQELEDAKSMTSEAQTAMQAARQQARESMEKAIVVNAQADDDIAAAIEATKTAERLDVVAQQDMLKAEARRAKAEKEEEDAKEAMYVEEDQGDEDMPISNLKAAWKRALEDMQAARDDNAAANKEAADAAAAAYDAIERTKQANDAKATAEKLFDTASPFLNEAERQKYIESQDTNAKTSRSHASGFKPARIAHDWSTNAQDNCTTDCTNAQSHHLHENCATDCTNAPSRHLAVISRERELSKPLLVAVVLMAAPLVSCGVSMAAFAYRSHAARDFIRCSCSSVQQPSDQGGSNEGINLLLKAPLNESCMDHRGGSAKPEAEPDEEDQLSV